MRYRRVMASRVQQAEALWRKNRDREAAKKNGEQKNRHTTELRESLQQQRTASTQLYQRRRHERAALASQQHAELEQAEAMWRLKREQDNAARAEERKLKQAQREEFKQQIISKRSAQISARNKRRVHEVLSPMFHGEYSPFHGSLVFVFVISWNPDLCLCLYTYSF